MGDTWAAQGLQASRSRLDRLPAQEQHGDHFVYEGAKYEFYV